MFSASPFSQSRRNRDDSDHGKRESAPNLTESQGVSESVSGSLNPVRGTDHRTPNPAATAAPGNGEWVFIGEKNSQSTIKT